MFSNSTQIIKYVVGLIIFIKHGKLVNAEYSLVEKGFDMHINSFKFEPLLEYRLYLKKNENFIIKKRNKYEKKK